MVSAFVVHCNQPKNKIATAAALLAVLVSPTPAFPDAFFLDTIEEANNNGPPPALYQKKRSRLP